VFSLARPDRQTVLALQQAAKTAPFTYPEPGMTKNFQSFSGRYTLDHHRYLLGSGEGQFEKAKAALLNWRQFELGWVSLTKPETIGIEEGSPVCLTVHLGPIWLLFGCRVVYTLDSERLEPGQAAPLARFGYAYGTLDGHPEKGEERFSVEWNRDNDQVWYEIVALSQPGDLLVTVAKPFARERQARFARDSGAAMQRICKAESPDKTGNN
jgi:uncharacterized protein (UPF0548 family)